MWPSDCCLLVHSLPDKDTGVGIENRVETSHEMLEAYSV